MAATLRVREALRWKLPTLVSLFEPNASSKTPKNTSSTYFIDVQTWEPWTEFRRSILSDIFAHELNQPYHGSRRPPHALERDCIISSEGTVTAAYYYYIWPIVNCALDSQRSKPHYTVGNRYGQHADWLCVNGADGAIRLVGDTKINYKWSPHMLDDAPDDGIYTDTFDEWQKVVGQILGYAVHSNTRYGLCVTDGGVTAFQFKSVEIPPSEVRTRSQKAVAFTQSQGVATVSAGHQRGLSDVSMTTAETVSSGSEYNPAEPQHRVYDNPLYAFIPWDGSGPSGLTPAEACFFLALMAANGDNDIARYYPRLDSYRLRQDGAYVHNTSGKVHKTLPRGAVQDEPDHQTIQEAFLGGFYEQTNEQEQGEQQGDELVDAPETGGGRYEESVDDRTLGETTIGVLADTLEHLQAGDEAVVAEDAGEGPSHAYAQAAPNDQGSEKGKAASSTRTTVTVKKNWLGKLYFVTPSGTEVNTDISRWVRVHGGYELRTKHHIYFAKSLRPK
ncbi:hypothetical protein SPI_01267 [Niveomyces insectorum RCEF 264]|uniref:Uncharacterized protein n=1 Tax=Niveomyces insectorum RCEF 264 TaxID=1081102 RepID=A0A167YU61_9HYPO|nr:hypothetical protein SPI_01267 [Niveomyces insectorum RCEF 264]